MVGIELTLTNGTLDWIDPVDEEEFWRESSGEHYIIKNYCHTYAFKKEEVAAVRVYQLCPVCGYEEGTCQHTWEDDGCEDNLISLS